MCSHGSDSCSGSQRLVSRVKVVYEFILSQPRRQTLISPSYHGSCTVRQCDEEDKPPIVYRSLVCSVLVQL